MGKWPVERWIAIFTVVLSIGAYAQTLRDTRENVKTLQQFNDKDLPAQYVPREVYDRDRQYLRESLEQLNVTLKELRDTIDGRRQPQNLERMFDR